MLTTGSWPAQSVSQCILPVEFQKSCEEFSKFYLRARTGRKLTWQTNMGTVDLLATYGGGSRKHILVVNTYQACILLLFNENEMMSYQQISEATNIPSTDLKKQLQGLSYQKSKQILNREPQIKEITNDTIFTVNENFTSKLVR